MAPAQSETGGKNEGENERREIERKGARNGYGIKFPRFFHSRHK